MASRDGHSKRKALIKQFCSVTGADKGAAKKILEVCNYNVEVAINMHVEADEPSSTTSAAVDSSTMQRAADASTILADGDDDGVRAPIPPVQGVLVGPGYSTTALRTMRRPPRSVFDGFRDFEAETRQQEQELYNSGGGGGGGQSVDGGDVAVGGSGGGGSGGSIGASSTSIQKRKTLEDLFRPPLDVMHKGTFDSARDRGQTTNRWLMVNIQNVQEFPCQVLNRDVWSNEAVKSIIREHFVFWQVYHDSEEGERYMQFYKISEWPYVAVIDPRTGENMIAWTKVDSLSFFDLVTEFLTVHPSLDGSCSSMIPAAKRQRLESILDASEDSQMEAAIKASLIETVALVKPQSNSNGGNQHNMANRRNQTEANNNCQTTIIHHSEEDDDDDEGMDDLETFDSDSENSACREKEEENEEEEEECKPQASRDNAESETDGRLHATYSPPISVVTVEWKKHLGSSEDPTSSLVIRFPDGSKEQLNLPSTSKLKALLLYVESKGFSPEKFELVTNFPKRQIDTMNSESSLKEVGLFPQETVFVQSR